jgi:hypothetical protein
MNDNTFRILKLKDDGVEELYVFYYNLDENEYKKDISNEKENYIDLIGKKNHESIKDNDKIKIYLINENINLDDTMETIKKKILTIIDNISFEEIYLFYTRLTSFNNYSIFETLSQNNNITITKERLIQYLLNFNNIDLQDIDLSKDVYEYNDIINLNLNNKEKVIKDCLGQRFFAEKKYPITINPFDLIIYDTFLEKSGDDILSTQNKKLLLEYDNLYENNIYLCTAEDVLKYVNNNDLSQLLTIKLYYPFLKSLNIENIDDLYNNKEKLIKKSRKLLNNYFINENKVINLFNSIYDTKSKELDYNGKGIKNISFNLVPQYNIILPLELVFKLIKTNKNLPYIKYNPGKGKEKIYRLYANKLSKNGKKIPYLTKGKIMKLRGNTAKNKSVTVYNILDNNEIFINFYENGEINIELNNDTLISLQTCEEIINNNVNIVLSKLKEFLEQKGYDFSLFKTLNSENINIVYINYNFELNITKNINTEKYTCFYYLFNILKNNLNKDEILMRYKRVSYFNTMESMEALFTELTNMNKTDNEIITEIEKNFNLSNEEARNKYIEWLNNIQVEQQIYENRKLKIKSNPGFPIKIIKKSMTNNILININNITNVNYIPLLNKYIDTFIRLFESKESSKVNIEVINNICGEKIYKEKQEFKDIESVIEDKLQNQKSYSISEEGVDELGELDEDEGLLGLIEEDEDDEEDEEDDIQYGGKDTPELEDDEEELEFEEDDDDNDDELEFEDETEKEDNNEDEEKDNDEDEELEFEEEDEPEKEKKEKTPTPQDEDEDEDEDIDEDEELEFEEEDEPHEEESQEEEPEEEKKETQKKKSKRKSKKNEDLLIKDIVGESLTNPNLFLERLYKRDPKLFLKKKDGKYNAYSRICPSNVRRQPVILTEKEKEKIDKENPGSYDHAIKYGSSKDNEHWYICPRYWCLLNNTAMTEEDIKQGKCGGYTKIIPKNAKKVPKDAFVYEFSAKSEHVNNKGEYIQHYPGFVKEGNHPDGYCIPCCFKSWDAPSQVKRREKCLEGKKIKKEEKEELDEYIKGFDKFPISQGRFGFLPISVQKILHTDNNKCKQEGVNNIKSHTDCLLRKGIENNRNQSFIGVIADVYHDYLKIKTKNKKVNIPSIKEMKNIIISSLNIDLFISYFSGSLVSLFEKENVNNINVEKYKDNEIYKKLNISDEYELKLLKKIIGSYENFIDYIKDDEVKIDHTFLWDIVSKPNKKLFPKGLNLCILELVQDDNTDNIEMLCPTNSYSDEVYNPKKQTLIIVKKEDFYEPIYSYRDEKTKIIVNKTFSPYNTYLISNIKEMLQIIKQTYNKCKPLSSLPKVYKFKRNKILDEVIDILKKINFDIIKQIVNYNNKVIGLLISKNNNSGYIPIEPSSIKNELDYDYIENIDWNDLNDTIKFLNLISKKTNNELSLKPKLKVLEDGLVVGIITETNQFIQLERPEENINFEDMEEIDDINYFISDKKTIISNKKDTERIKMIKKIKLENNFYNSFRNSTRILLNKYENLKQKREIEEIIERLDYTYYEKLELLKAKIVNLLDDYVEFSEIDNDFIMKLDNITNCLNKEKCKERQYCLTTENDCKLILPKTHLISGNKNNENIYYYRLADEFIRYGRIRNFMFKPRVYLSLDKLDYNLTSKEIILLDTILTKGYFEDLEEVYQNKYISNNDSEFVQPQMTQKYSSKDRLKNVILEDKSDECIEKVTKITGGWSKIFNKDCKERIYKNNEECTFQLILDILKDNKENNDFSIEDLRKLLVNEYNKIIQEFGQRKILNILKDQGKDILIRQINERKVTLEQTILSTNYYLTNLDIILISEKLDLPIIIFSGNQMNELIGWNIGLSTKKASLKEKTPTIFKKNRKMWIIPKRENEYYYFIKQPIIKQNSILNYSLIIKDDKIRLKTDELNKSLKTQINIYKKRPSFEDFIKEYLPIIRKRNIKLKLKKTNTKRENIEKSNSKQETEKSNKPKKILKKIKLVQT